MFLEPTLTAGGGARAAAGRGRRGSHMLDPGDNGGTPLVAGARLR